MTNLIRIIRTLVVLWPLASCRTTHHEFLESDGIRLRYQVSGRGPAVVLLHGFGEALDTWNQAGIVRPLSSHFRVLAMDVRGHGGSAKPDGVSSYGRELAADVVRLLDHHGVRKAHLVGYSMGGLIALDVAAFHQERVSSLVLGGVGWPGPAVLADFRQQALAIETGGLPGREAGDAKALVALLRSLDVLSDAEVRRITIPVLVLVGADDRFMPDVQRLSRAVPDTEVVVIPGANHATAMRQPGFRDALVAWLLGHKGDRMGRP